MTLAEFLYEYRWQIIEFAEKIGCSRQHLSRIVNWKITPSYKLAKKIEKYTYGKVSIKELMEIKKENE